MSFALKYASMDSTSSSTPTPILYCKQEIGGIMVRPDTRGVLLKSLTEKRPIEVASGNDYINLYHVFERLAASDKKKFGEIKIVRKQVGPERWLIFLKTEEDDVPEVPLLDGYDPKRGRYKRLAMELANGNAVTMPTKEEAIKARRAWQLYVPSKNRRNLRSTIREVKKSGKFIVMVLERAG